MSDSLENKIDLKDKLISYLRENRRKVILIIIFVFFSVFLIISFNIYKQKKNELISEKFVQAKLFLQNKNKNEANIILEEIIFSKNKFYSILALNTIIERNLIEDKIKIIEYFKFLEQINIEEEQKDLLNFKKGLFLIKHSDKKEEGYKILKKISDSESSIKLLAREILDSK